MTPELLPCPFCGGTAQYMDNHDTSTDGGEYVSCSQCQTSTALFYAIKEDVKPLLAERWNRRDELAVKPKWATVMDWCNERKISCSYAIKSAWEAARK